MTVTLTDWLTGGRDLQPWLTGRLTMWLMIDTYWSGGQDCRPSVTHTPRSSSHGKLHVRSGINLAVMWQRLERGHVQTHRGTCEPISEAVHVRRTTDWQRTRRTYAPQNCPADTTHSSVVYNYHSYVSTLSGSYNWNKTLLHIFRHVHKYVNEPETTLKQLQNNSKTFWNCFSVLFHM